LPRERGAVDWTALTALMATVTMLAALFLVVRGLGEIRRERREARFAFAVDALWRLGDEWSAPEMAATRSSAAASLLAGRVSGDVDVVLRFFDRLAFLTSRGRFDEELVWHEFHWPLTGYWFASVDYRSHLRADDSERWHALEALVQRLIAIEAKHRNRSADEVTPSNGQVREFLLSEASAGECAEGEEPMVGARLSVSDHRP
jgi:hypothetical protein